MINTEPLSRGPPHSLDVYHYVLVFQVSMRVTKNLVTRLGYYHPVGFEIGNVLTH